MTYFNVQSITYIGELPETAEGLGGHENQVGTNCKGFKKQEPKDLFVTIDADYEHYINKKFVFKFQVTTIYLVVGFDKNQFDKELQFMRFLLIKSFAHLQAILAAKFQDKGEHMFIPDEPDYSSSHEAMRKLLWELYK